jgi:GNAT superfamily N-acetyltransferase
MDGVSAAPLIRPATPADVEVLHRFVVELAATEEFPGEVTARPSDLADALFGPDAVARAVLAEVGGEPAGFALFYPTYSTVVGRTGVHLDDLYVRPEHRGSGVGRLLLAHLAELAVRRGGRLEWWVLRTNEGALRFYHRLGARLVDELDVMRLEGAPLTALAGERPVPLAG